MIVIISGTNRHGSNTRKVTARVEASYKTLGVTTQVLDSPNCRRRSFAPTSYAEKPAGFKKFTDAILAADGVVIVTPNKRRRARRAEVFHRHAAVPESFEQRPVCFIGLAMGIWGALRPV